MELRKYAVVVVAVAWVAEWETFDRIFRPWEMSSWFSVAFVADAERQRFVEYHSGSWLAVAFAAAVVVGAVAVADVVIDLFWEILVRFVPGSEIPYESSVSRHLGISARDILPRGWSPSSFAAMKRVMRPLVHNQFLTSFISLPVSVAAAVRRQRAEGALVVVVVVALLAH